MIQANEGISIASICDAIREDLEPEKRKRFWQRKGTS
jgi:hypothetical protein